ncbi:MAG: radical SAM/SPASM domain-containing protein [Bacteroidota bacterium]
MIHPRKARLLLQSLSLRKLFNFGQIMASFYYSRWRGKSMHKGNPIKIGFEPTTFCNLRCPECPSGLRSFTRPTGMVNLALFEHTVDQLQRDLIYLLLYFQGEPYLHPDFLQMAAYANSKGIYTATSTNGHYLTESKAKETVESGISEVLISIDGTTQETYQSYRVGGNLEKVKQGVKNLVAAREAAGTLHPYIFIQFLVVRPNEHQIEEIEALGKELGVDKVVFKTAQIYDFENGNPLIPTRSKYSRYRQNEAGKYEIKNTLDNQCWKLWHGAEVTWDGKVLPCCFDKDAQYEMGSLQDTPFEEVWRSKAYNEFRQRLLKSRSEIDICQNCSEGTKVWG